MSDRPSTQTRPPLGCLSTIVPARPGISLLTSTAAGWIRVLQLRSLTWHSSLSVSRFGAVDLSFFLVVDRKRIRAKVADRPRAMVVLLAIAW